MKIPALAEIQEAHERVKPYIHHTPVMSSSAVNEIAGARLFFKCENFQKAGAFKIRGASNSVFSLEEAEASKGVATHSSGNFAQALSLAASWRSIKAYVVMPSNAPEVKRRATMGYGAEIIPCEPTLKAREETLEKVVQEKGATFIHPYNYYNVVCGQGTVGLELCEQASDLDIVVAPVGGGGLISGVSIALKGLSPNTEIIGAEPAGADDAFRSLQAGRIIPQDNPQTIADGLRTSLGELTFTAIRKNVKTIITVSEEKIIEAMKLIWERMKIIVEPSSAITLGAVMTRPKDFSGKRVGLVLSGGNVDLANLPW
jgi:threonine dehydratase